MNTEKELREALDDLCACIGTAEIDNLQPETVQVARANHDMLWHTSDIEFDIVRLPCGCISIDGQGHLPYQGTPCAHLH